MAMEGRIDAMHEENVRSTCLHTCTIVVVSGTGTLYYAQIPLYMKNVSCTMYNAVIEANRYTFTVQCRVSNVVVVWDDQRPTNGTAVLYATL